MPTLQRRRLFAGDNLRYTRKVLSFAPIAYWPLAESGGSVAFDASANARNGAYSNVTLGLPGIGDGRTGGDFNGSDSRLNAYSAGLAGEFNGQEGSAFGWFRASSSGIWTDGVSRRLIYFQADGNNRVYFERVTPNNAVQVNYVAGGTFKIAGATNFSPTTWFCFAATWSKTADQLVVYINGAQVGATQTSLGTFAGSLGASVTNIGCTSAGTAVWSGNIAHVAVFNYPLSAAQIATLAAL